jgi:AcrR family transcriptional regulator
LTRQQEDHVTETAEPPAAGLRERKKARTRIAIQDHALRLFREQGYDETSVEQIADAAEVSPSTFFRYFPTKEDVVLYDPVDPVIIEAFRAQPRELGTIAALRAAMRQTLTASGAAWMEQQRDRADLILAVPELRRRMLDQLVGSMEPFAQAIGERVGRPSDDFAVQTLIGAVLGVGLVAWLTSVAPDRDYVELMDAALAQLEAGLPV